MASSPTNPTVDEGDYRRFRQELDTFLRVPSISTDPERAGDVRRCAGWVAGQVESLDGFRVEIIDTAGHPVVVGERMVSDELPTLLTYGHYDVQPSEPDDLWTTPPFEPTERDGRLYARGSADDKGQVHMHLKALELALRSSGDVRANLKVIIEGEEEVGSKHLGAFLVDNAERLACDGIVISDTQMFSSDLPCITTGLRGIAYFEINVTGPRSDLHSGSYGGAVVNPAGALAQIVAGLKDDQGRATVSGYYDDVRAITAAERESLDRLPMNDAILREQVGAPELGGEAGFSALERLWYRPALDVNGLLSGWTGDGSKTVLPSRAMAKVSMRLVPDQDADAVAAAFEQRVGELAPPGVTVDVRCFHAAAPWVADTRHPVFDAAGQALESGFGAPPAFIREGGSIPIVQTFEDTFESPALLMGFALPGCNAHAPDEWLDLGVYCSGIAALADFYRLAGPACMQATAGSPG